MKFEDLLISKPRKSQRDIEYMYLTKKEYPEAFKIAREMKDKLNKSGVNYFVSLCLLHKDKILPLLDDGKTKKEK